MQCMSLNLGCSRPGVCVCASKSSNLPYYVQNLSRPKRPPTHHHLSLVNLSTCHVRRLPVKSCVSPYSPAKPACQAPPPPSVSCSAAMHHLGKERRMCGYSPTLADLFDPPDAKRSAERGGDTDDPI